MNQQLLLSPMRTTIAALALTCAIGQQVQCANDTDLNWGNAAQFSTAFLTLPAGLAAQAKPDSKGLALLNHTLKLANELFAAGQQNSLYSAGWACFDTIQGIRALTALITNNQPVQVDISNDNDVTDHATSDAAPTVSINNQQWQKFVHYAGYVLVSAEAITRMGAASQGNTNKDETHQKECERIHSLTSLIRLAHYCLEAPDKEQMAVILVLLIANSIESACRYATPNYATPNTEPDRNARTHAAMMQGQQALRQNLPIVAQELSDTVLPERHRHATRLRPPTIRA